MPEKRLEVKWIDRSCNAGIDRVQFVARTWTKEIPEIPGFRVCRDSFVRPQTAIRTYPRVRNFKNPKTGTVIYAQYWAAPPWLEPVKLTVVGDDSKGLQRAELETVCRQFRWTRLLTVELAIDFAEASGVDRSFVLRHGLFGKSRLVGGRFFEDLRYGTRHSDTMVRAYKKPETESYRVEVELHSPWLRRHGITQLRDLSKLPQLLCFSRINFVAIDWDALADHLRRKRYPASALNAARSQAYSIHRALSLLRGEMGLVNVRQFFRPLRINAVIKGQLEDWSNRWRNSSGTSL
jgi:hypothetical protein